MAASMDKKLVHEAVTNIPPKFHSADLRDYFSQFIEQKGFDCFHFRHRPESRRKENDDNGTEGTAPEPPPESEKSLRARLGNFSGRVNNNKNPLTTCCIVRLTEENSTKFINMYHKKPWVDKTGEVLAARCIIVRIRVSDGSEGKYTAEQKKVPEQNKIKNLESKK